MESGNSIELRANQSNYLDRNGRIYLIKENQHLHQENEKIREILRIGIIEFENREKRIKFLQEQLEKANQEIERLRQENEFLKKKVEELEGKNRILSKTAFGKKSEKRREEEEIKPTKPRGRKQGHIGSGRKIPENLPEKEEIIEIPPDERFCPDCGLPLVETGMEEISREVCVEKRYYVKVIKRKTYKKTCHCAHPLITAPLPGKIIPKSKFSLSFWVEVLINKYKNHLPIARQVKDMQEYGLEVSSGTIFGGIKKIYFFYLESLYQGLIRSVRDSNHIYIDESGWKLFVLIDDKGNYNDFIWVYVCKDIKVVVYVIRSSRAAAVPCKTLFDLDIEEAEMLKDIPFGNKKRITVDRFSAYKTLERLGLVELTYCWAHQRRDFIEAKTKYPELKKWADIWIEKIAQLYHINNERIKHNTETESFKKYDNELRLFINQMETEINSCLVDREYRHPQQQSLMESMKTHWQGLTRLHTF